MMQIPILGTNYRTFINIYLLDFFADFKKKSHFANHPRLDVALYYSEGEKTEVNQSMTTKNLKNVSFYDNLQAYRKFLWQVLFYILLILSVCVSYKVEQKFFFSFSKN